MPVPLFSHTLDARTSQGTISLWLSSLTPLVLSGATALETLGRLTAFKFVESAKTFLLNSRLADIQLRIFHLSCNVDVNVTYGLDLECPSNAHVLTALNLVLLGGGGTL
jgi:hypothetical protein